MLLIIVAALATWQIVEIWHHSFLLAPLRSRTELWENKLGELLGCPYCLSVWVAFLCVGGLWLGDVGNTEWYSFLFDGISLVIHGFAVSRLANLGNDFFHPKCRTPKSSDIFFPEGGSSGADNDRV